MGLFDKLKKAKPKIDLPAALSALSRDEGKDSKPPPLMEWDKVYVEIDNDANGTVSNESPTQRRRNRPRRPTDISGLPSMYDDESKLSKLTFESKSYGMMGNPTDENYTSGTLSRSNIGNTFTSEGRSNIGNTFTSEGILENTSSESGTAATNVTAATAATAATVPTVDVEMPEDTSRAATYSITKNGKYLANNYFANAQLMRWKHAAEEGPCIIQNVVFLASIAAVFTTLYPLVIYNSFWSVPSLICAFHTTILCTMIVTLEVRVCGARNPLSLRAKIRNVLVRHMSVLRLVWGRGILYIFAGSMNITIYYFPYNYMTGGFLIALGLFSMLMGAHAAFNLERLRLSLTDHSYLWNKFVKSDSDQDNLIGIDDFSNLIWSLGLELDDTYTFRAFLEIDQDRDGLINFYEFKLWWIASQDDDGTIVTVAMSRASRKTVPNQISMDDRDTRIPGV